MNNQELLTSMLKTANEGVAIGVRFNDQHIDELTKKLSTDRVMEITASEWEHDYAVRQAMRDDFFGFANRRMVPAQTSMLTGSGYDIVLNFPSADLAQEYLAGARQRFPAYTFVYTVDPKENLLKDAVQKK